ncbi:MAG: acyl-CoA-binding protein [Bacteroidota bacterium]|nr:acyl-CoA-binding protein [Bacteroidota bacterium]
MNTEEQFEAAKKRVQTLSERPDNNTLLKLYGLNKQATLGDCNEPSPPAYNFIEVAKQNAWKGFAGKSKDAAMHEYIALVDSLFT